MSRQQKIAAGAALALALWSLAGFFLVPWLVARELPKALTTALDVNVELGEVRSNPFLLTLQLDAIELRGPASVSGLERIAVDALFIDVDFLSLLRLTPEIDITVRGPALRLSRAADGRLPILAWPRPSNPELQSTERASKPPELLLSATVEAGSIAFRDAALPEPAGAEAATWSLSIAGFDPSGTAPAAPVALTARSTLGVLGFEGAISPERATGSLALEGTPLAALAPWVVNESPLTDLAGQLTVRSEVRVDREALALHAGSINLAELSARATTSAFAGAIELGGATLTGIALDLRFDEPELASMRAGRFALEALDLTTAPAPGGGISRAELSLRTLELDALAGSAGAIAAGGLAVVGPQLAVTLADTSESPSAPRGADPVSTPAGVASAGMELGLGALTIDDLSLALTDPRISENARIALDSGRINLGPLSITPAQELAAPLTFEVAVGQNGTIRLQASGESAPGALDRPDVRARETSDALRLSPLAPWLRAASGVDLLRGVLTAELDAHWSGEASVQGEVSLGQLRLRDGTGVPLLSHERLDLEGMEIDTGARRARIDALILEQPRARFARYADGRTNLDSLKVNDNAAAGVEAPDGAGGAAAWSWEVGLALHDGFLNMVDETLIASFATSIETLEGEAGVFGSAQPIIDARLSGVIPPVGRLQARALTDTRDPLKRADIDLEFTRLSLLRLSPYSGTFAGRHIEDGELGLELEYRIENGRLKATNRAAIESLRLGDRVDSPAAVQLPLDLAIAVLKDADGRIELDVPVSGEVEDPDFNLTPAILRALRVVITSVATAPFKMLGALAGSDRDLEGIDFDFGSATLDANARETITALADVLQRRPNLALTITPVHAGRLDRDALRVAALDTDLAALGPDRDAAVLALARERLESEVIDGLSEQYGDAEGRERAISEELAGLLLARIEVNDEDVARLAVTRAEVTANTLVAAALLPDRVHIATHQENEAQASERMRLAFELRPATSIPTPGANLDAAPQTRSPASGR